MGVKKASVGSAMLLILGLFMMIMLAASVTMRLITQMKDIAHMRVQSARQIYATEAMLLYGIAWYKSHTDLVEELVRSSDTYVLYNGPLYWIEGFHWQGALSLVPDATGMQLRAQLSENGRILAQQSCYLIKDEDGVIKPTNWSFV
jgi:hypothetical protein